MMQQVQLIMYAILNQLQNDAESNGHMVVHYHPCV